MNKNKIFITLPLIAVIATIFLPLNTVLAATQPILDGVSSSCIICGNCTLTDLIIVFMKIYRIIMGLIGSLTLIMFIIGGLFLITSAGNSERVDRGKKIISGSVVGLIITLFTWTGISFALFAVTDSKKLDSTSFPALVSGNWAKIDPSKDKLINTKCEVCCCNSKDENGNENYFLTTKTKCKDSQGKDLTCDAQDQGNYSQCVPNQ